MTNDEQELERLAAIIDGGRFPSGMNSTPWKDEDPAGRTYCFRIARAVRAHVNALVEERLRNGTCCTRLADLQKVVTEYIQGEMDAGRITKRLPTSGPAGPSWAYTLARVFRRTFIALVDDEADKIATIESIVKLIMHYYTQPDAELITRMAQAAVRTFYREPEIWDRMSEHQRDQWKRVAQATIEEVQK